MVTFLFLFRSKTFRLALSAARPKWNILKNAFFIFLHQNDIFLYKSAILRILRTMRGWRFLKVLGAIWAIVVLTIFDPWVFVDLVVAFSGWKMACQKKCKGYPSGLIPTTPSEGEMRAEVCSFESIIVWMANTKTSKQEKLSSGT